ncbi:hypothetical protein ACM16X_05030 [Haloarcula japonica]
MKVTLTCRVCGRKFEGKRFSDVKDDLTSHFQAHQRAGETGVRAA